MGNDIDRRTFLGVVGAGVAANSALGKNALGIQANREETDTMPKNKPNVLFIMTDQQRYDSIAALGNPDIYSPNFDRLVRRGATFRQAYSSCPVCVPARYNIRTGREPHTTAVYQNGPANLVDGQPEAMEDRCGAYLARTMRNLGYRTFGIGKFHTHPQWNEDLGYDVHLHTEELYGTAEVRSQDAYAGYIEREHPCYDFIEGLHGERTEMYYIPQMSPMPAEHTVEGWVAKRAVEQIKKSYSRPYFGFISFIGPHPPLAPPIPFNRLYDPDRMPNPVRGDIKIDHMDEQITWMNHLIWADDINDYLARVLRSRYYGELTYIDHCIGLILDAVEASGENDNTLICFFSDHGEHLGDHAAWQKESFFEVSAKVPFLLSWPAKIPENIIREDLVSLTDLFGIATTAAGTQELRDGTDVLGAIAGVAPSRDYLFGLYGTPGTRQFKIMVRHEAWKYIFFANGNQAQLFNLEEDPKELTQLLDAHPEMAEKLHAVAVDYCRRINLERALDGDDFRDLPFEARPLFRIHQFARSRGVTGFPEHPRDVLDQWEFNGL